MLRNAADIYDLRAEQLLGIEFTVSDEFGENPKKRSMQEKSVQNLMAGIEASKQIPFERVLFALGIRFVGETVAKKLARHFKTIDAISSATFEQLIEAEEIGDKIAQSILDWFAVAENRTIIERLRAAGLQLELDADDNAPTSDTLKGMTFVVSGVFQHFSRDGIKASIESHGGKVSGSISKKTNFILAGDSMGPEKRKKAEELGVKIIDEGEYVAMIGGV
jgi:DNA ligase (NAD+)